MIKKIVPRRIKRQLIELRIILFRLLRTLMHGKNSNQLLKFSHPNYHIFFGYYDITPFSFDDKKLLAIRVPCVNSSEGCCAEIGYYDLGSEDKFFHLLDKTQAWNWQQGCRLQWFGEAGEQFIYNIFEDNEYRAVLSDINNGRLKIYNRAFYAISTDGKLGLSLDFSRLQRLRPGYGYNCLPDLTKGIAVPEDNGIWQTDLATGDTTLLLSFEAIIAKSPLSQTGKIGEEHYINHLCFNPSGKRFLFFHLRSINGKRQSRLMSCNYDGSDLHCVDEKMNISHYCWKSDTEILGTGLYDSIGVQYRLFDDKTRNSIQVAAKDIFVDGHPTFLGDKVRFITDSYPDLRYSERELYVYDMQKQLKSSLVKVFSPMSLQGEQRCDLHPRLSHCEKYVCIDLAEKKRREIAILPICNNRGQ